jgi:hypothetical protein
MTNIIPFEPKTLTHTDSVEGFDDMPDAPEPTRRPYSFDMSQAAPGGMVLIDACVPEALASQFLKWIESHFEPVNA